MLAHTVAKFMLTFTNTQQRYLELMIVKVSVSKKLFLSTVLFVTANSATLHAIHVLALCAVQL